jgi:hypothetical protein
MTTLDTANTATSLRGPLLAAHRSFRTAVNHCCAEAKSQAMATALTQRELGGENPVTQSQLRRCLRTMSEMQKALSEFGGPEQIPQYEGFAEYVLARQTLVSSGCEPGLQVKGSVDDAPCILDARLTFAQLFEASFGEIVSRVAVAGPGV